MLKISKAWIFFTMVIYLACCQGLFVLIQSSFGDKIIQSTQGQLRQELDFSNFNFLARSITDSTTSGFIRCAVLDKVSPEFIKILNLKYMGQSCEVSPWLLKGSHFDVKLRSLNGDLYRFQFVSNNPAFFDVALWGFRVLGLIAIAGIMLAMKLMAEKKLISYKAELEVAQKVKSIALQVSHDIRSPLSALKMALQDSREVAENPVIYSSLERINDIANNLLDSNSSQKKSLEINLLAPLIESVISEKRHEYADQLGVQIEFVSQKLMLSSELNQVEFKRVLSNLINNAVEALEKEGKVTISLAEEERQVIIKIKDNGKGMSPEVLEKIGTRGFSSGKKGPASGTGLGVAYAKEIIASFKGKLEIKSKLNVGSEVIIFLPSLRASSWMASEIDLRGFDSVFVLDDDASIHSLWKHKLKLPVVSFFTVEDFKKAWQTKSGNIFCLIDFDLQQKQTGLDIIKELDLKECSILVSGSQDNENLIEEIQMIGISFIPKMLLSKTPILQDEVAFFEYVYIDDDKIMRLSWEKRAKDRGVSLLTLINGTELVNYKNRLSKTYTKIYIDSDLGEGHLRGEELAALLYEEGYEKIHLATGYPQEHFSELTWLKVIGKECPF